MKHEELARYLVQQFKKKGADDVVVQLNNTDNSHIKFSNNKVTTTKLWNLEGMSVFVAKDKKVVSSSLKSFSKAAVKELVSQMMQSAKNVPPNPNYRGIAKGPFKYKVIKDMCDEHVVSMDTELIDITKQSIDVVKHKAKRAAGVFEQGSGSTFLVTSNDVEVQERYSHLYFSMRALMNKNASGHTVVLSRTKKGFDYMKTAEHAADIAKKAHTTRKSISGSYDVIFEPHAFANLLENLAHSASIFSVEAGLSCLKDALGKKVASDQLTLYDDATVANGYGSSSFDDEGHPTQKNALIENGVFKTYLHNTSTAERYNTKNTANAGLISPEPHNIVVKPGTYSKDELFSSVKKGIYITNVWYTRFNNYATGDFSTIPRDGAFYIENGEIKYALKDVRISDNLLTMMKNVVRIGKEVEQIKSWEIETPVFSPYVVIKDVQLSKPS